MYLNQKQNQSGDKAYGCSHSCLRNSCGHERNTAIMQVGYASHARPWVRSGSGMAICAENLHVEITLSILADSDLIK